MKKTSLVAILLLLVLLLCACGGKTTDGAAPAAAAETPAPAANALPDSASAAKAAEPAAQGTAEAPVGAAVPEAAAADTATAPVVTEVPAVTVAPTQAPVPVTVTKSPTDEYTVVGGNACFIAHAENYSSREWFFVSPDGTLTLNKGAFEDRFGDNKVMGATEDTMFITGVTLEMEGWQAFCRFTAPYGSTVDSAKATVHALKSIDVYQPVLETYTDLARNGRDGLNSKDRFYGDVEMFDYDVHSIGYYLSDLNGDGVDEMVICCTDQQTTQDVYAVYALQNGSPATVFTGWPRNRYYLLNNGKIYNEGSGGAALSMFNLYSMSGAKLQLEGAWLYRDGVYYTVNGSTETPISEAEFDTATGTLRNSIKTPPAITPIR